MLSAKQPGDPVFKEQGWADCDGKPSMAVWHFASHRNHVHRSIGEMMTHRLKARKYIRVLITLPQPFVTWTWMTDWHWSLDGNLRLFSYRGSTAGCFNNHSLVIPWGRISAVKWSSMLENENSERPIMCGRSSWIYPHSTVFNLRPPIPHIILFWHATPHFGLAPPRIIHLKTKLSWYIMLIRTKVILLWISLGKVWWPLLFGFPYEKRTNFSGSWDQSWTQAHRPEQQCHTLFFKSKLTSFYLERREFLYFVIMLYKSFIYW